jgi:hypothetical protein
MTSAATELDEPRSWAPSLDRWGAAFAGALVGLATFRMLETLWDALARGSEVEWVSDNISWLSGGSAIACLFLAGFISGWVPGIRGTGVGAMNGLMAWALILVGTLVVDLPSTFHIFNTAATAAEQATDVDTFWAPFVALAGGLVAAAFGGTLAGQARRNWARDRAEATDTRSRGVRPGSSQPVAG